MGSKAKAKKKQYQREKEEPCGIVGVERAGGKDKEHQTEGKKERFIDGEGSKKTVLWGEEVVQQTYNT